MQEKGQATSLIKDSDFLTTDGLLRERGQKAVDEAIREGAANTAASEALLASDDN